MAAKRGVVIGLVALLFTIGAGMIRMQNARTSRIVDYTNFMTETHQRAMVICEAAHTMGQQVSAAIAHGEATPEDLAELVTAFNDAAEKTRLEKEAFARVMPPTEAVELQKDGLEFLDVRIHRAETFARYFGLFERKLRGEAVNDKEFAQVTEQAENSQAEVMRQAKELRNKKDALMMGLP